MSDERTEAEKDALLARLADEVDDPVVSQVFEMASRASPSSTKDGEGQ